MLNEIKEYEQYTDSFSNDDNKKGRLKRKLLVKAGLSGITRPMIIIARRFLFENGETVDEKSFERARTALKLWCGTKSISCSSDMENIRDWLPRYIREYLMGRQLKRYAEIRENDRIPSEVNELIDRIPKCSDDGELKQIGTILTELCEPNEDEEFIKLYNQYIKSIVSCIDAVESLSNHRKNYGRSMFEFEPNNRNDFKMVTYDSILATALTLGPLKRYYLYCDDVNIPLLGDADDRQKEIVLKTAAAFLMGKNSCPEQKRNVFLVKTDIFNWLKSISKFEDYILPKMYDEEKDRDIVVFTFHKITKNAVKLYIKPSWIEHFRLIEEDDFDSADIDVQNGAFYRDDGSNFYLAENAQYEPQKQE